jgi:hypothetical protein
VSIVPGPGAEKWRADNRRDSPMMLAERMPDQAGAGTTVATRHANLYTLSPHPLSAKRRPIVISME